MYKYFMYKYLWLIPVVIALVMLIAGCHGDSEPSY